MPSPWTETRPNYASIPGVDPAVDWALGEGSDYFFPSGAQRQWMPILVQLKDIDPAGFQRGGDFIKTDEVQPWLDSIRVSKLYIRPPASPDNPNPLRFCTALVTREFFDLLLANPKLQQYVGRLTLGLPLDRDSLPDDLFDRARRSP